MSETKSLLDEVEAPDPYDYSTKMKANRDGWLGMGCKSITAYAPIDKAEMLKGYVQAATGKMLVRKVEAEDENTIAVLSDRRSRFTTHIADLHGPSGSSDPVIAERAKKLVRLIMKRNQCVQEARTAQANGDFETMAFAYALEYALSMYVHGAITVLKHQDAGMDLPEIF